MLALDVVLKNYNGTNIECENTYGLKNDQSMNMLDCNCVDCGSDSDCSTDGYEDWYIFNQL